MTLTMKDITNACAVFNRFKYEAGPYGVTIPPPGSKGFARGDYVRIEPLSGIASPGRWRIKQLPRGEPISGVISTKRQLRTALLEWLAEVEYGPRPPPRDGYTIYAHDNRVRTSIGMANAIVWSYRKIRVANRRLVMSKTRKAAP
jgi:hypothetical protein